jgi:hypothetical protein
MGGLESTIGQAISLFHKHKHKLPEDMRSVFKYNSPGDLWKAVKQFQGELSGKELKKEEQEKIYRETEFIYKDEVTGFQIISPLTEDSAKWWGKGTRWCTAADNNNMFEHYASISPLFILLIPNNGDTTGNGEKLQLWKSEYDIQFMDEADNSVSLDYIEQNWKLLEPICLWLNDLRYIPEQLRTEELCKLSVQKNGWTLRFVPEKYKTPELCETAIKQNGSVLMDVPDELRTKELCLTAIQNNGDAFEFIPNKYITKEICEIAVKQYGNSLWYVPDKYKTKELYELAVQQDGNIVNYVPEEYRTKELYEMAVQQNGNALDCVPEQYKTKEMCELAIKQYGSSLYYVPECLRTKKMYKMSVKSDGHALCYIPEELRTEELYKLAIKQNGNSLQYITDELRTKELCKLAIQQNKNSLRYVPDKYKDEFKKHVKEMLFELPIKKYQETFQEIKTFF